MILNTKGSFEDGVFHVEIDVQPHTEQEHELLLLLFKSRTVSLTPEHEGDALGASFTIVDKDAADLAVRNLQRVKNGELRFFSVNEEKQAADAAKKAAEDAKKAEEASAAAAKAKAEADAKAQTDAVIERAAQIVADRMAPVAPAKPVPTEADLEPDPNIE